MYYSLLQRILYAVRDTIRHLSNVPRDHLRKGTGYITIPEGYSDSNRKNTYTNVVVLWMWFVAIISCHSNHRQSVMTVSSSWLVNINKESVAIISAVIHSSILSFFIVHIINVFSLIGETINIFVVVLEYVIFQYRILRKLVITLTGIKLSIGLWNWLLSRVASRNWWCWDRIGMSAV